MKASAIRIDIKEVVPIERAVPRVAIATATIKFQLQGNLAALEGEGMNDKKREEKLKEMLWKALQEVKLD